MSTRGGQAYRGGTTLRREGVTFSVLGCRVYEVPELGKKAQLICVVSAVG